MLADEPRAIAPARQEPQVGEQALGPALRRGEVARGRFIRIGAGEDRVEAREPSTSGDRA